MADESKDAGASEDAAGAEEITPETKAPEVEVEAPQAKAEEPKAEVAEPKAEATEPKAEATEPKAEATEPKAAATEPKAEVAEPKAEATEPKAAATEPKAEVAEPKAEATKPKAEAAPADNSEEAVAEPTAKDVMGDDSDAPVRKGPRKGARQVPVGVAHIKATFNNTIVSIADTQGGVIAWSTGGRAGFKGSRKSTAFAATVVGQDAARQAVSRGMSEVEVRVQGAGSGRESAIRALQSSGLSITVIKDVTPIPHNGCRPRKRRRV
jgi:small subunit ribosomal protein S11